MYCQRLANLLPDRSPDSLDGNSTLATLPALCQPPWPAGADVHHSSAPASGGRSVSMKGRQMGLRRLRSRLDDLQANANQTMSEAQQLLRLAQVLVEELTDGIDVTVYYTNPLTGEKVEVPGGIRLKPRGEDKQDDVTTQSGG